MRIEEEHKKHIQTLFIEMVSREDLLELLNYAKPFLYSEKVVPFKLQQITYYANPKRSKKHYKEFQIKKKSGGKRTIYAPENGLKVIQKALSLILQCVFEPNKAATGFVMGKSIVDNAKAHIRQNYVYNIDLKDFFPSIEQARIWACLKLAPFNLTDNTNSKEINIHSVETGIRKFTTEYNEEVYYKIDRGEILLVVDKKGKYNQYERRLNKLGKNPLDEAIKYIATDENTKQLNKLAVSRDNLANIIASLSCSNMQVERKNKDGEWTKVKRNVLPQGAPTSPVFSNIICQKLDRRLTGVAKRFKLNYTRYADDITFSSMHNVYQENSEFLKEINRIVKDQNFDIKVSKTRLQKRGYRQEVTGVVVNNSVNVRKRYIKQIRMWLYYWEKYGYTKAENIFLKDYSLDKEHVKITKPNFENVLCGKLEYLKMVKGFDSTTYLALNKRFKKLIGYIDPLDSLLNEWENNGIESVMVNYRKDAYEQ